MAIAFENTVFLLVPKENASVLFNREKLVHYFKTAAPTDIFPVYLL
jgi:hypothetical protein